MKRNLICGSIVSAVVVLTAGYLFAAEVKLHVLNPRGEITLPPVSAPSARIADLAGKKIGLYWNGKAGGDHFWNGIESLLKQKLPNTTVLRYEGSFDLGDALAAKMARVWPGVNDMALVGRPSQQFYVFAENQEFSPWAPFHVTQGFEEDDSCVTISSVMSAPANIFGGGAVMTWTPEQILDSVVNMILGGRTGMAYWKRGSAIPGPMKYILFFEPTLAMELAKRGQTRASLQKSIYERATIPYEKLTPAEIASIQPRIDSGEIPKDRVSGF